MMISLMMPSKPEMLPALACLPQTALRLESVGAGYSKKPILRNLSLAVGEGEFVALIGANGAGKSTLLQTAMGLLPAASGNLWIGEQNVTRLPAHERARQGLGYLLQGGQVFPSLTVQENLEMGTYLLPSEQRASALADVLETFPTLRPRLSHRAGLLSGGQRQTLALGMVLAQRPRILLLDEPSAGLSPLLAQELLTTVQNLNARLGLTVLMVEQRVREALQIAHRAVVLVNGSVAAETSHPQEWLTEGALDAYFFGTTLPRCAVSQE